MFGLKEKREWHEIETRAKLLPLDYYKDFQEMKKYIWATGVSKWDNAVFIFNSLLDLLEETSADGRKVTDITGPDVASFLDGFIDEKSWEDKQREILNNKIEKLE
ncbi:PadR family transcriptional regulator [Lactococcus fujiensis JCM 16395]|uniref:PadR family transcriptional regulator n=2 Tax=Lactococcus fujiensis TaxID=610251 RepID=A0A2A5RMU0_9LACT|nr:PadR family transcriptional regulator [Lactococcus fujiensis JCM 16395]